LTKKEALHQTALLLGLSICLFKKIKRIKIYTEIKLRTKVDILYSLFIYLEITFKAQRDPDIKCMTRLNISS